MEDKKISEQESIELITAMINRTKERYNIGDGNIMLMWGILTVLTAAAVWLLLIFTQNQLWNWLWFAIPVAGGIATPFMSRRKHREYGVKSYSDVISSKIWTVVGITGIVAALFYFGFLYIAQVRCSQMWFAYALIIVPMAEICQGFVIKEKSFVWGGFIGLAIGIFTICCIAGHVTIYAYWFMPLFMLAFTAMMIVPGYVLNRKAKLQK